MMDQQPFHVPSSSLIPKTSYYVPRKPGRLYYMFCNDTPQEKQTRVQLHLDQAWLHTWASNLFVIGIIGAWMQRDPCYAKCTNDQLATLLTIYLRTHLITIHLRPLSTSPSQWYTYGIHFADRLAVMDGTRWKNLDIMVHLIFEYEQASHHGGPIRFTEGQLYADMNDKMRLTIIKQIQMATMSQCNTMGLLLKKFETSPISNNIRWLKLEDLRRQVFDETNRQ